MTSKTIFVAAIAAFAALGVHPAAAVDEAGPARMVGDGVYTDAQVARGMETFRANGCNGCHGDEMEGTPGGPTLAGFNFNFKWRGKTLDGLLTFVRENMPPGSPGSLNDQQYTDVIAAVISRSGHPAGTEELTPEALTAITVPVPPKKEKK